MAYNASINRISNKNPAKKIEKEKDPTFGIYMGEVIATKDISRTGRLHVFVAALAKDKQTKSGYYDAIWSSPFAGSTNPAAIGKDIENPNDSMQSYGMWMVPPDIGNYVLIAFGDGNTKYPIVISCLYQDKFNHMVPGLPAGNNFQMSNNPMPTVEKNKRSDQAGNNSATRPIQHTISEAIVRQGLAFDPIRGTSTSGARRESPSEVFGILTPGPRDPDNFNNRLGGHSFVMDDNLNSRNIRIRTAQGNQILLDDNQGMIYIINKSGKVWLELSENGAVQLYADNGIHFRTRGDFNLRADKNVNIEAGQDVNIKAAGDTDADGYAGPGTIGTAPTGIGGNLNFESQFETRITSSASIFQTSASGDFHLSVPGVLNGTSGSGINLKSGGKFTAESAKKASIKSDDDISLGASGNINENSGNNILMNSGGADPDTAEEATSINSIATYGFVDQPDAEVPYDKNAENPVPTGGVRTGQGAEVKTIVNDFVTIEPWEGHGISNPAAQEAPGTMAKGTSVAASVPAGGTALTDASGNPVPASANTPNGYQQGSSFDSAGNPVYGRTLDPGNNFNFANKKDLAKTMAAANTVAALHASLPSVRSATLAADSNTTRVLGSVRRLTDLENQTQLLAADAAGRKVSLNDPSIRKLQNIIQTVSKYPPKDGEDLRAFFESQGVAYYNEGDVTVYVDAAGNTIRDISRSTSLSNETNYNITQQDFLATQDIVKQLIPVAVSDNQLAAMTSMAMHIGPELVSSSDALGVLANGNYHDVPRAMLQFSYNAQGIVRPDYKDRRIFEGELFQTPDFVPLPNYGFSTVSWKQQARDLRNMRNQILKGI